MKEEYVLLPQQEVKRNVPRRRIIFLVLLSFLITRALSPSILSLFPSSRNASKHNIVYPNERNLIWEACGETGGRKLECSRLNVPMDQFNQTNSGNKTFSLPLIRLRGHDHAENILVNPGGPGGSGVDFVLNAAKELGSILGPDYHVVGFDPRGINGSIPAADCFPDLESRRRLRFPGSEFHPVENSPEMYAWTQGFVRSCVDTLGAYGGYINTPQTAADMNTILDALGQHGLIYWGFSYGTVLGQTYASLFPERSHRVIIDGVVDTFYYYTSKKTLNDALLDAPTVLLGFFQECVKAGDRCPLSSLAKTPESLQKKVLDYAFSLKEPQSVYLSNSNWGMLKQDAIILSAIFQSLYSPPSWPSLASNLASLLHGNATPAYLAYGIGEPFGDLFELSDATAFVLSNDGPSGPDAWPQDRETLLDIIFPALNDSMFAPVTLKEMYKRQQWPFAKTHNFTQPKSVNTSHPLLILSAEYDPVTPLSMAKTAHGIFQGSQIVEREGYGHTSIAMPSRCVGKIIREFLSNGTLPDGYTRCSKDKAYFGSAVDGDGDGAGDADAMMFESEHDRNVHIAQVDLARKMRRETLW